MSKLIANGTRVVKTPCKPNCVCDGASIPDGTVGRVKTSSARSLDGTTKLEYYYEVMWDWQGKTEKKAWWTFSHALEEEGAAFPDMLYLEGV